MLRSRPRRWWIIAAVALPVAVAGLVALFLSLVPADRYRSALVQYVEEATGRRIEVGRLRLAVLPAPHLSAAQIRLPNPAGFPPGNALAIKSLRLGIGWGGLLFGKLDVRYMEANGVEVHVISTGDGRSNFAPSPTAAHVGSAGTASVTRPPGTLNFERVRRLEASNVSITIADVDAAGQREAPYLTVTGLNGRAQSLVPAGPAWWRKAEMQLHLAGATLVSPALATPARFPTGEVVIAGGHGTAVFVASLDTIRFRGTADIRRLAPFFMTFALSTPSLDLLRLGRLLTLRPGPAQGPGGGKSPLVARGTVHVGRVEIAPMGGGAGTGTLSFYSNSMRLDAYRLSAYGGSATGSGSVNYAAPSLPAVLLLRLRGVDLRRVVQMVSPRARGIRGSLDAELRLGASLAARDPRTTVTGSGGFSVRDGSFPSAGLQRQTLAMEMAKILRVPVPGPTLRFTYFGGDFRIGAQQVRSAALRLDGPGVHATGRGSFGFDRRLNISGVGVLKTEPGPGPNSGIVVRALGWLVHNVVPEAKGASGVRLPFALGGTFDRPTFTLTGTPEFVHGEGRQRRTAAAGIE